MYNEFVKMYCSHFGLEIKYEKGVNWVLKNNERVGSFYPDEKIIAFNNGTKLRKGDLLLSILEGTSLHDQRGEA